MLRSLLLFRLTFYNAMDIFGFGAISSITVSELFYLFFFYPLKGNQTTVADCSLHHIIDAINIILLLFSFNSLRNGSLPRLFIHIQVNIVSPHFSILNNIRNSDIKLSRIATHNTISVNTNLNSDSSCLSSKTLIHLFPYIFPYQLNNTLDSVNFLDFLHKQED